ncbi:histidine kinase [Fragilaria crotonensis]|nr:histidine kinase [Fragilaria crotonensis]
MSSLDMSDGTMEKMDANASISISDHVVEHEKKNTSNSVERCKELNHVVDWFSRATNGDERFEVVTIEGNPGEKKTQLLLELQDELDSHNSQVIRLKNDRIACSHQMSIIFEFYEQLIDLCNKAPNKDDIVTSLLKEIPGERLDLIGSVFPAICDFLGIEKPPTGPQQGVVKSPTRTTPLTDHCLEDACCELIRISTSKLFPVVILFEDFHWAGPELITRAQDMVTRLAAIDCPLLVMYVDTGFTHSALAALLYALSDSRITIHQVKLDDDDPDGFKNYIRLVNQKIENLSDESTTILKVASLLGIRLRPALLEEVICALDQVHDFDLTTSLNLESNCSKKGVVLMALREFVDSRLMTEISHWYHFIDDAVYDAVLSLLDADPDQAELCFKVGRVLHHLSAKDGDLLLPSVIHLNSANGLLPRNSQPVLAQLNLDAAKHALHVTSFSLAVDYASQGLAILGDDKWRTDYALSLDLTTALAEMALADKNYDECKVAIDEVIRHARSVGDKLPVYYVLVDSLREQGRYSEAIKIGMQILHLLGEKTKYNRSQIVGKSRTQFKKNAVGLSERPQISNVLKLEVCKLLHQLGEMSWMNNDCDVALQCLCRVAQISLKYGVSQYSALGFAGLGVGLRLSDYLDESELAGQLALALEERFDCSSGVLTGAVVYNFIDHWHRPYGAGVEWLKSAYWTARTRGNPETAIFSASFELTLRHLSGESLLDLNEQCDAIVKDATMYGKRISFMKILPAYQFQLNMTGTVRDVEVLSGAAMKEESYSAECAHMNLPLDVFYFQKMKLAYYFGSVAKANEYKQHFLQCAVGRWHLRASVPSAVWFGALIAIEMYKSTSKKTFLQDAKKDLQRMRKWEKRGCTNVKHMVLLLEAEIAAATRSPAAVALFEKAIESATAVDYVHDRALANERAAVNCLFESNTELAGDFMVEASRLYKRWGASAKVTQINTKYPYLFYDQNSAVSSFKSHRPKRLQGGPNSLRTATMSSGSDGVQPGMFARRQDAESAFQR